MLDKETLERVAKRSTKAVFVNWCITQIEKLNEENNRLGSSIKKLMKEQSQLKNEAKKLKPIRDVVETLLGWRCAKTPDPTQLSLMLGKERNDLDSTEETNEAEHILGEILDNCDKVIEEFGGGHGAPSYYELEEALSCALGDREALLKRLGLTEFQWSLQGGASYADVEP